MDTTLHRVRLASSPAEIVDIGIHNRKIVEIGSHISPGDTSEDLDGRLVLPGFVETHIHLDKSCILERCSMSGGLPEAISEVARLKSAFTEDDIAERASRTLRKAVINGTMHMRTHVEVDPVIGLRGYHGVKKAIREWSWAIDVEICVFPQEGLLNNTGTDELMVKALEDGAKTIGAAPYTDTDPRGQIDRIFYLAQIYDVDIDMHLDFGEDARELDVDYVCKKADETGWGGRVTVGHVTKLALMRRERFAELAKRLANAGVSVTVLPATDLFLTHRSHRADLSVPRGVTPAHLMTQEGVNCSLASNNIMNPFTPFGDCSQIRMANLYANIVQVGSREALLECFNMVSQRAAKIMNLKQYGIEVGNPGDIVAIDAYDPALSIAELAQPMFSFKAGRPVFSRPLPHVHSPSQ